ncbi:DnaJ domain-containing protein [Daldinia bambusicola]|nr:DnaJ domain-containing protein [Daldinia bambusicola]
MPPLPTFDCYAALEIAPTATTDEINVAYRRLAMIHHPDKNPGNDEAATAAFQRIQSAYEVLQDPNSRAQYDHYMSSNAATTSPWPASPEVNINNNASATSMSLEQAVYSFAIYIRQFQHMKKEHELAAALLGEMLGPHRRDTEELAPMRFRELQKKFEDMQAMQKEAERAATQNGSEPETGSSSTTTKLEPETNPEPEAGTSNPRKRKQQQSELGTSEPGAKRRQRPQE